MAYIAEILNNIFNYKQNTIYTASNPKNVLSKANYFGADQISTTLITPPAGKRILIRGITMTTTGTVGTVCLRRGNGIPADPEINTDIILPIYANIQNRAAVSNQISITLDVDETIDLEIDGVGAKDTFVGISYEIIEKFEA